ncbi:WYL domain-containing protein [Corynebacterium sp. ES2794-CONJ1]|uniref:helix-turn-helix transcriptional regulator n=1 Tax=unclassified Corynebacterium TaxID=2624378 RepID=UPI00216977C3|nr:MULTISPECIES: WYL domain-containing protein [unclassified Corynebacterium]MCS4489344.1 WYL domain-containing protein [Corynebacterium sp. ES2775-CONJ]MCS4491157.1 WYL domain-containing protein [Corynebacterium sp. ES2715-CONJ3]MCS4530962.1 WYL domain-containing protein [Corynebacterium sp. ES2730-CONJ]MCU9518329.1 WYL domain-containing protein [Corynebacterium sp. ES2794-CONJ1]
MATPTEVKLARITNLTFALLEAAHSGRRYLTFEDIYRDVYGYAKDAKTPIRTVSAARRLFTRDIDTLISLGVPLENVNIEGISVWCLNSDDYQLPPIEFTEEEARVLSLVGKMDSCGELATFSRSGWTKLAASGVPSSLNEKPLFTPINDLSLLSSQNLDLIDEAIAQRKRLRFYYQRDQASDFYERWIDPWALLTYKDRLYLIGYDIDRAAPRCFRLRRLSDISIVDPQESSAYGDFNAPAAGTNFLDLLIGQLGSGTTFITAELFITPGVANDLRSLAQPLGDNRYVFRDVDADWLKRQAMIHGPSVRVESPDSLIAEIRELVDMALGER